MSTIFLVSSFNFAQTQPSEADTEKEKKKKALEERVVQMLEQAIGDAPTLRLAQNRAIVYALAGDLLWKFDEKRSRDLFRNAAAEILSHNHEAEKERRESADAMFEFFDSNDARAEILPLVAKHDADLALDLLVQTRPARLAEAILRASQPNAKMDGGLMNFNPDKMRVQQEVTLEQRFALLAADENPEKAIKLIKDSLARGISRNVMPLLQKLNKKGEKKAAELAGDVIKKLVDSDLAKKDEDMRVALSFLQYAAKPGPTSNPKDKAFTFSEAQIKDLANKMVNTFLQPSKSMTLAMILTQAMPLLEKLAPDRIALLKQREAESQRSLPPEIKDMQQRQKLWDPSSTAEDLLAQLPKLTNDVDKTLAYQSLAMKIGQIDDEARAKKLIEQIPDDKARASALEQFESARISRSASSGKLEDARKMIGNLTKKKTQIQKLVALATEFHKKGTEKDIEIAKSLMKEANGIANDSPEDEDELNDLMEVVKGYAVVEPDVAFRMFEPIIDQINDFVHATAILSKYNKRNRSFKKGELVMKVNGNMYDGLLLFKYVTQMQLLGKADLERMSLFSDRFQRSDSRTLVKLFVVQGYMKDDKNPDNASFSGGGAIFYEF